MPQSLAGDVSGVSLSSVLAATLARAADHARSRKHRQISLEHLLLALTGDEEAAAVLAACNVDIAGLHQNLAGFLDQLAGEDVQGGQPDPVVAIELKRILDYAAAAALQGGRSHVNGAIVLAAMIGEGRSRAASFLQAQGLTFESAVRVLQEQSREQRPAPQPSDNGTRTPPSAEEILATARERVASRGQLGGHARARPQPPVMQPGNARDAETGLSENAAGNPLRPPSESEAVARDAALPPQTAGDLPPRNSDPAKPAAQRQGGGPPPLPQLRAGQRVTAEPPVGTKGDNAVPPTRPPLPAWMKERQGKVHGQRQPVPPLPGALTGGGSRLSPAEIAAAGDAPVRDAKPSEWVPDLPVTERPAARPGELIENVPRRMTVGVSETVELRLSRDETEATVHGSAGPIQQKRFIAKALSTRLRAPDGLFVIEASSPETQWIEAAVGALSAEFMVWRFIVTPTRRGEGVLQVVISARTLGTDGVTAETVLPERFITVRVRPSYRRGARQLLGWISALLIGVLLAKFGGGLIENVLGLLHRTAGE